MIMGSQSPCHTHYNYAYETVIIYNDFTKNIKKKKETPHR